jgi:hypothetical protein
MRWKKVEMKKYKNRIVNDLERRLSKIDTEKKILFLKKMDVAKGYVIEIFCNQFLKNKIAIDLFKRSVSKKTRVPILAATLFSLHNAYYFDNGWLCLDTKKSAEALSSLEWIFKNLTGSTKDELIELDKFEAEDFISDYFSEIDTEEKLKGFEQSLRDGFRAILPVENFYDYKTDDFSLLGTHGTTINVSSVGFIQKYDELSISIPTLSLVRDFTFDNIGVFNNEVRDLSHLDESATILNKKTNHDDIDFILKKFSVVYSGVFPASILTSNELEELIIWKEVCGKDEFNDTVVSIARKLF